MELIWISEHFITWNTPRRKGLCNEEYCCKSGLEVWNKQSCHVRCTCSSLPYIPPHDSNPVSSPWNQYLVPDKNLKHLLPADGVYEDPACVLHRAHQKHLPDLELVKQKLSRSSQSVYQHNFCSIGDFESKRTRDAKIVLLPPEWTTPLTTQRCSYRDPKSIMTMSAEPPRYSYKDNLVPNDLERQILRVRTGETDYMATIGSLGDFILREKLYGEGKRWDISVWEVKRRLALLNQGSISEGLD